MEAILKENLLNALTEKLLMGPGPSNVHESVYQALCRPTIGHLDPDFIDITNGVKEMLRKLLHTQNVMTFPVSGTGSAGMEISFVNLVEPGDAVLILSNGVFGMRMQDVASRLGANVDALEFEWGTPVTLDAVKEKLQTRDYKIVAVVHAETSTGVMNPVSEIGELVRQTDSLYLVDAVTSFGGMPVKVDEWNIDVLYSGTQKCLSCPPGLAPVTFSEKALEKIRNRKSKVPNWYLDINLLTQYWDGATRTYHHTAPINMIYALYQALYLILEEGEESVFARHRQVHESLVSGLNTMGLDMLVAPQWRLPMLNSVKIPQDVDDVRVRKELLQTHKIEIGAGLGALSGMIWRVGIMGHSARMENVKRFLDALGQVLAS